MLQEKKMNIKNSVLDSIRYKQMNWYGHVRRMNKERPPQKNVGVVFTWKKKKKKGQTSKFVDVGSNTSNGREGN